MVHGKNGAVASSVKASSKVGLNILKQGGSFADAVVAISASLCVLEPSASHLGGDAFAVWWDAKSGKVIVLNSSGMAPRLGPRNAEFLDRGASAVTVPGLVRAWQELHDRYGKLPLQTLLEPAIEQAEDSVVGARWARSAQADLALLTADPGCSAQFLLDGKPPTAGQLISQPQLARLLSDLAVSGCKDFYEGHIARQLVQTLNDAGSHMTLEDFASHRAVFLEPLAIAYRGHTIHGQPPQSQGIILLMALGMLEGFATPPQGTAELVHLQAEACKLAAADSAAHLGDPATRENPTAALLDPKFLERRRRQIDLTRAARQPIGPGDLGTCTTQFCVADSEGNVISFIQSIFSPWGAGFACPKTGVLFNNRMTGFRREPGHPNSYAPGKKPIHTLNVYVATKNGRPVFAGGTPGAHVQVQTNTQVVQNLIDFGVDAQHAIDQPRWAYRADADTLEIESRFDGDVIRKLEEMGHTIRRLGEWDHPSNVQLIRIIEEGYEAASDPRGEGCAMAW